MENKNLKTLDVLRERERERAYLSWSYLEGLEHVPKL